MTRLVNQDLTKYRSSIVPSIRLRNLFQVRLSIRASSHSFVMLSLWYLLFTFLSPQFAQIFPATRSRGSLLTRYLLGDMLLLVRSDRRGPGRKSLSMESFVTDMLNIMRRFFIVPGMAIENETWILVGRRRNLLRGTGSRNADSFKKNYDGGKIFLILSNRDVIIGRNLQGKRI